MTGPPAPGGGTGGAPPPGRLLLVGLAVLLVVAAAGLTATRLGAAAPADDARATTGAPVPATAPASGDATAPGSTASAEGPEPGPVGPEVLPGEPIPGPGSPLASSDGVTPTTIRVPAAGVDVALVRLGLQDDGTIEVPTDPDDAGWLGASAVPGRTGPAVVAGHVDSSSGPAVFARLDELAAGDPVEVDLSDGTTVRYTVTGSESYPKDAFPSARVYGPAPASLLRLVTCGGRFDRSAGSYEDNLVVYAVPTP